MTVRLPASHPDAAQFAELAQLIALATNPHMAGLDIDLPAAEQAALVAGLKDEMARLIEQYVYLPAEIAEAVNRLENKE